MKFNGPKNENKTEIIDSFENRFKKIIDSFENELIKTFQNEFIYTFKDALVNALKNEIEKTFPWKIGFIYDLFNL